MSENPNLTNLYPSLKGKKVFITGGGYGIGAGISEGFLQQGASVVFIGSNQERNEAFTQELKHLGNLNFIACDVRDTKALKASIDKANELMGGIDILINNVGNDDRHKLEEVDEAYFDNCLEVNLKSHFFASQSAVKYMKKGSSIINLGSINHLRGRSGFIVYATCKGAISAFNRSLARELGELGIRVNSVVPGAIVTPKQQEMWLNPQEEQKFLDLQCLKFRLQINDVVAMVLFLASDDARACSNQNFIVDGGIV